MFNSMNFSSERLPSKERKISNDPDGRVRTVCIERTSSLDEWSSNRRTSRNVNLIRVHDEYRPNEAAMTFWSGDRDLTSNGDDSSMLSYNLISKEEADRIYQKLAAINLHGNNLIKRNWTNDEIRLLEFAVDKFCQSSKRSVNTLTTKDWKSIATFIPGRTESQWLYKWKNRVKQKAFTKSTWSTQEDRVLCNIVNQYGSKNWPIIANLLNQEMGEPNKRVGKQWRERWLNHLQPSINKSAWSPEEDLVLLQNHKKFSNQWAKIAKYIPGRTENKLEIKKINLSTQHLRFFLISYQKNKLQ